MPLSTQCPHCEKVMKLKSESFLGKKVSCPKCGEGFTVKKYQEPEAIDEYEEPESYEDYEEEAEERPARRSNARGRSAKKAKPKRSPAWIKPALTVGAIVLALSGLIGIGVVVAPKLMGRNVVDLTYLPDNSDVLMHFEPREIWNAPMVGAVRNLPQVQEAMKQSAQGIDLAPEDIESITVAMLDVADMHQIRPFGGGLGPVVKRADAKAIGVVRVNKDLSDKIVTAVVGGTKETHQGQTLTLGMHQGKPIAYWPATPRLCVFGDVTEVKKAIDRGGSQPRLRRFDFVKKGQHIFFAMAPEKVVAKTAPKAAINGVQRIAGLLDQHVRSASFGLTLGSDLDAKMQFVCHSSAGAEAIQKEMDTSIADVKTKSGSLPAVNHPASQTLVECGKELVQSINISKSGSSLNFEAKLSGRVVGAAQQVSENPLAAGIALAPVFAALQGQSGPNPPMGSPGMMPPTTTQP